MNNKAVARWADELDGVFTLANLRVALDENGRVCSTWERRRQTPTGWRRFDGSPT
jgi:hypothetical protein